MTTIDRNKHLYIRWFSEHVVLLLAVSIFIGCGRSDKSDTTSKISGPISMMKHYPISNNSYWEYQWENLRGDRWRGAIGVIGGHQEQGLNVFILADTTEQYGQNAITRSAYLWDGEGLKHLYRASASRDCTAFRPPRFVIPLKMEMGKPIRNEYTYEVYSPAGNVNYTGEVRQNQSLIEIGSVEAGGKRWENCIAVETVWTDSQSNGNKQTRRKLIWYADGVGPVKIISGIPVNSSSLTGDATGDLTASH